MKEDGSGTVLVSFLWYGRKTDNEVCPASIFIYGL